MMAVFVGTLLSDYYSGSNPLRPDDPQTAVLRWAEDAVNGFAATKGRLPCPSRTPGGLEDCRAASDKGWLPVATIDPVAAAAGNRPPAHVLYTVYRGTGGADPDLAVADDAYRPTAAPDYPRIVSSSVDLCGKLIAARPTRSDRASVASKTGASGFTHIAYGLVAAFPGTSAADSPLNAGPSPKLENPLRRIDGAYRDKVRSVDFDALGQALSCSLTLASLDMLAIASTWPDEPASMRTGTIDGSERIVKIEAVVVASEVVDVTSSTIDTVASIATGIQAKGLVTASLPGLPVTLPAVTLGSAGILTSIAANKMAVVDTVTNALGLATESGYALIYLDLALRTKASRVWPSAMSLLAAADAKGTAP